MTDRPMPWRRPGGPTTADLVARARRRQALAAAEEARRPAPAPTPPPPPAAVVSGRTAMCPQCGAILEVVVGTVKGACGRDVLPDHVNHRSRRRCIEVGAVVTHDDRRAARLRGR